MAFKKYITTFLFFLTVLALASSASASTALNDGIVSYYNFDNNTNDSVGVNDAVNHGAVLSSGGGGIIGESYYFDGSNDYMDLNFGSGYNPSSDNFTINFWVKTNEPYNGTKRWFGAVQDSSDWDPSFVLRSGTNGLYLTMTDNNNNIVLVQYAKASALTDVSTGDWVMITWTKSGNNASDVTMYIDGVEASTSIIVNNDMTVSGSIGSDFYLGTESNSGSPYGDYFESSFDEVGFWNKTLSTDEITELYNTGSGFQYPFTPPPINFSLVSYYPFDTDGNDIYGVNNATVNSATLTSGSGGIIYEAYGFDGIGDYITLINITDTIGPTVSFSLWMKTSTSSTSKRIFEIGSGNDNRFMLTLDGTTGTHISGHIEMGSAGVATDGTTVVTDGAWHNIIVNWNDVTKKFNVYVDGNIDIFNATGVGSISSISVKDMTLAFGDSVYTNIDIDEVGIWNRELSSDEAVALYNSSNGYNFLGTTAPVILKPVYDPYEFCSAENSSYQTIQDFESGVNSPPTGWSDWTTPATDWSQASVGIHESRGFVLTDTSAGGIYPTPTGNNYTLSTWFYPITATGHTFVFADNYPTTNDYLYFVNDGTIDCYFNGVDQCSGTYTAGLWYYATYHVEGSTGNYTVLDENGTLVTSGSGTPGGHAGGNQLRVSTGQGVWDDFRVWEGSTCPEIPVYYLRDDFNRLNSSTVGDAIEGGTWDETEAGSAVAQISGGELSLSDVASSNQARVVQDDTLINVSSEFSYRFNITTPSSISSTYLGWELQEGTFAAGHRCIDLRINGGTIQYVNSAPAAVGLTIPTTVSASTKYEMLMEVNQTSETFDLFIDGVEKCTNCVFREPAECAGDISTTYFAAGGTAAETWLIDDVSMYPGFVVIEEPAPISYDYIWLDFNDTLDDRFGVSTTTAYGTPSYSTNVPIFNLYGTGAPKSANFTASAWTIGTTNTFAEASSDPRTISLWIYNPDNTTTLETLVCHADSTSEGNCYLPGYSTTRVNKPTYIDTTVGYVGVDDAINIGEWYHLAYRFDGTNMSIFINGIENKSLAVTPDDTADAGLSIGGGWTPGYPNYYYTGLMDEFKYFTTNLSDSQITNLYNCNNATYCEPTMEESVLAYYTFDEPSGNATDSVGNYNLTQYGDVGFDYGIIGNSRGKYSDSGSWFRQNTLLDSGSNEWGISFWVYLTSEVAGQQQNVFSKTFSGGTYYFECSIGASSKTMGCYIRNGGAATVSVVSDTDIVLNTWNHFVWTGTNETTSDLYLNNVSVGSTANVHAVHSQSSDFFIATRGGPANGFGSYYGHLLGYVDEMGIWNTTLSTDNIAELYNSGDGYNLLGTTGAIPVTETSIILPASPISSDDLLGYCNVSDGDSSIISAYDWKFYKNDALFDNGTYGGSTLQITESVFNLGTTYFSTPPVELSDGRLAVAYQDAGNSNYGTISICNSTGGSCVENVFNSDITYHNSLAELSDGSLAIAYRDAGNSNYGTFAICNSTGGSCIESVFNSGTSDFNSLVELSDGNLAVAYSDGGNSGYPTIVICNSTGGSCIESVVNSGLSDYTSLAELSDGRLAVAYQDSSSSAYGAITICNSTGGSCTENVFNSDISEYTSLTELSDGRLVVAYKDGGNSNYGTISICNSIGGSCVESVFNSGVTNFNSFPLELGDGRLVIPYQDGGNSNYGTISICNSTGGSCVESVFNADATYLAALTELSDGRFVVAYRDDGNSSYGTFAIINSLYNGTFIESTEYIIATLSSVNTSKGDDFVFACRATDSIYYSDWLNSSQVTIFNSIPVITNSTIFNITLWSNETLTGFCDGTDVDGDSLYINYTWYVNRDFGHTGPRGITVYSSNIWTSGAWMTGQAYKWSTDGNYITEWDTAADGNTDMQGITTDGTNIWTVDYDGSQVYKWTMDGVYISNWDTAGVGNANPRDIATDGINIWTTDYNDAQVYKWTMAGSAVDNWDTAGQGNNALYGLTTDGTNIWTIDYDDAEVRKWTMSGSYVNSWDTAGDGNNKPYGVTTNGAYIWTSDITANKIYQWSMSGIYVDDWTTETIENIYSGINTTVPSSPTLTSDNFNRFFNVTLSCQVGDYIDTSSWLNSSSVIILNTPLIMTESSITPISPMSSENLTGFCNSTDYENDDVSYNYTWFVNGVDSGAPDQNTLEYSYTVGGDSVVLQCAGTDYGDVRYLNSTGTTIENTPPAVTNSTILTTTPASNETIIGLCDGTDYDGDALSANYIWYVNDVNTTSGVVGEECYQESATVSNQTGIDGICDLDYNGILTGGAVPDVYMTYVKPPGATNNSKWKIKHGATTSLVEAELEIPQQCWDANSTHVALRIFAREQYNNGVWSYAYCHNGTSWVILSALSGQKCSIDGCGQFWSSGNWVSAVDGNWGTGGTAYQNAGDQWVTNANHNGVFFEEAMVWWVRPLSPTLSSSNFNRYDNVSLGCQIDDGANTSTWLNSSSVEVLNTPPVIIESSITPISPLSSENLTGFCNGTDYDNDAITYEYNWYVNETLINEGCLQETANVATSCGGLDTGTYGYSDDGDFGYIYINYTKPEGVSNETTLWQVKLGDLPTTTVSIPGTCFDAYGDKLVLQLRSTSGSGGRYSGASCYNSTAWIVLHSDTTSGFDFNCENFGQIVSPTVVYDGNYNTYATFCRNDDTWRTNHVRPDTYLYEEAMIWGGFPLLSSTLLSDNFNSYDNVTLSCQVSDNTDTSAWVNSSVVEALNTPLVMTESSITPVSPLSSENLTGFCNSTDYDLDSVSYNYTWFVNGANSGAPDQNTLADSYFDTADLVVLQCTGTDNGDVRYLNSTGTTIENTPLVMTESSITPVSPFSNETLTGFCNSTDYDLDSVSYNYTWFVNGADSGAPDQNTLADSYIDSGDLVVLECAGTDNGDTRYLNSSQSSVSNTPLIMTSAILDNYSPLSEDTLTATCDSTDYDNDSMTYNYVWFVNDADSGAPDQNTLADSYIDTADTVIVQCQGNDGTYDRYLNSSQATVLNTPLVMTESSITPVSPLSSENLTGFCNSTDYDNDVIDYDYAWFVNDEKVNTPTFVQCYQESSDVSNQTGIDGDCGLLYTGAYSQQVSHYYVNYTKPAVAVSGVWIVKFGITAYDSGTIYNITIPDDCWNYDNDILLLDMYSSSSGFTGYGRCYNGTSWNQITTTSYVNGGGGGTGVVTSGTNAIDGNWATYSYANDGAGSIWSNYAELIAQPFIKGKMWYEESMSWTVPGYGVLNSQILNNTHFNSSDSIILECQGNDNGDTRYLNSTSVVAETTAPVMVSAGITPPNPLSSETLTATCNATDYDNDGLTYDYTWYVNDVIVGAPNQNTLADSYFAHYDNISVECRAFDSVKYSGLLNSSQVYAENTIATIDVISFIGQYSEETLSATCDSSDYDNDGLSEEYEWYVNEVTTGQTGLTLAKTYSDIGDNVTFSCRVHDGTAYSAWSNSSITTIINHGMSNFSNLVDDSDAQTEIGSTVNFDADVVLYDDVDQCTLYIKPVASPTVFDTVNMSLVGTITVDATYAFVIPPTYNSEYDNITWWMGCNDISGNFENSTIQSLGIGEIGDYTEPEIEINTSISTILANGTVVDSVLNGVINVSTVFSDNNLFQASVNITCDVSGGVHYWENLAINGTEFNYSELIDLTGLPPQQCNIIMQSSDDHTVEEIPEYDYVIESDTLIYETENGLEVSITSSDYTNSIDTTKLVDRYNFEFGYDDSKLIRKYIVESNGLLFSREGTVYPGHFVAWNPQTHTGNWIDFAIPHADDFLYIVNKINDNKYEIVIAHKVLANPDARDLFDQNENPSLFALIANFFTSEQPLETAEMGEIDVTFVEKEREMTAQEIEDEVDIQVDSEAELEELEEDFGIQDIIFNSIGGTNVQEVQTYFYIGGVFNITSNNQFSDIPFTGYTARVQKTDAPTTDDSYFFNVTSQNYVENVIAGNYELTLTHPEFVTQSFTPVMEVQYDECEQELANESTACGGLGTGAYGFSEVTDFLNVSNMFDGDIYTYATVASFNNTYLYANYTIPVNVTFGEWSVTAFGTSVGVDIPIDTLNKTIIQVRIEAQDNAGNNYISLQEYNGSGWADLTYAPLQVYNSQIFEEKMTWHTQVANQIDIIYNISQSIITFIHRNVKTSNTIENYTLHITTGNITQEYNITDGTSGLTVPLNANVTYNVTFIKEGHDNQSYIYTFDYQEEATYTEYVSYTALLNFINEATYEPFNFTDPTSAYMLVKCEGETHTYSLTNATFEFPVVCDYTNFRFILTYAGGTSYYRTLIVDYEDSVNSTFYLIDISVTPFVYGSFIIDDLFGSYENPSIYIKKSIPGEVVDIQSDYTDIEGKVGYYLIENNEYIVEVHSDNEPIQIIGTYSADVGGEKVISMYEINLDTDPTGFTNTAQYTITIVNNSGAPNVLFNYNDADGLTTSVQYRIYADRLNGTLIYESAVYTNVNQIGNLYVPILGYENRTLVGDIEIIHQEAGTQHVSKLVNKEWGLNLGIRDHVSQEFLNWFFIILLSVIAIYASMNTNMVALGVTGLALLFVLFGWFGLSMSVLVLAILIAIFDALSKRGGR